MTASWKLVPRHACDGLTDPERDTLLRGELKDRARKIVRNTCADKCKPESDACACRDAADDITQVFLDMVKP